MPTIEALKRKIDGTIDLQTVVKTMKALAAVNIRQFEKAVSALEVYHRTVEMGLQVVLRSKPEIAIAARPAPRGAVGAVVIGSDQGMCGQLNETVVAHAVKTFAEDGPAALITVGIRALNRLEEQGYYAERNYPVPGAVDPINDLVLHLLLDIENWNQSKGLHYVDLFYCRPRGKARYRPHHQRLLPLDRQRLRQIRSQPWPTRVLPTFTLDWDVLFSGLIRHYLYGSLFRAVAESLASENASRLAAMQGAESNIEENLEELRRQYQQQRQMSITSELLDIVGGFEALR